MKLAIMQPYLFPYIGYFQLINSVDKFIIYDDVSYIKGGWINRNNILLNGNKHLFTLPLRNSSSFALIKDIEIDNTKYTLWCSKFLKTIEQAYRKAPYYLPVASLINKVLKCKEVSISGIVNISILEIMNYLQMSTIIENSSIYHNNHLQGQNRIISICKQERASTYINAIGGEALYSRTDFIDEGIDLKFISSKDFKYKQFENEFISYLSIIDILMFNSVYDINTFLSGWELI